jgi:xylan 1,4-beta-xylosidase
MYLVQRFGVLLVLLAAAAAAAGPRPGGAVEIRIDATAPGTPFPHFWERMFGSGRAVLALRDDYRRDLEAVHKATGFEYVRFHGILDDDVGVVDRNGDGKLAYNFTYLDQIYDGLLARGVRPFVELSFMPAALTSDSAALHSFAYHPNVAPPRNYAEWDDLMRAFARHLIARYGIDEVARWYFEVWNEPNLDFWAGKPAQASYFELYDHTARALKAVSPRLRVGGPATAQTAWIGAFLAHTRAAHVPVDFVSTHVYGDDTAENVFGRQESIPRRDMVCRAVDKAHREVEASPYPALPLIYSEYNASYRNIPAVEDSVFMGPWLANAIRACAGKVSMMSYWTFSDVFEEQGVPKTPFYGGFGVIAPYRIPKPSFNAFAMLHRLGDTRLQVASDSALASRRADGTLVLALWNYAPPAKQAPGSCTPDAVDGADKHFAIDASHLPVHAHALVWRLDAAHGNVLASYRRMGCPAFPSREQLEQLRAAARPAPPERLPLHDGRLSIGIPPQGLAVIELR